MAVKEIVPNIYTIPLGAVNAFLIDGNDDGLILIDTGASASAEKILQAVAELGKQPTDIKHILVTHCHPDHSGSLAALKAVTGAPAYMHATDAALVREGRGGRTFQPGPGLLNKLLARVFIDPNKMTVEAAEIEHEVNDGQNLPLAGGIMAIHTPGHCAGQLAFLWTHNGGVLFAADAAAHMAWLGPSIIYEDYEQGIRSLAKLADFSFDVACFGHGRAIKGGAKQKFQKKWGEG